MLMDLFYDTLPAHIKHKRRVHFHQFMIDAHKRMHAFKTLTHRPSGIVVGASSRVMSGAAEKFGKSRDSDSQGGVFSAATHKAAVAQAASTDEVDPIPPVAMEFAAEATVLCFDEFQVSPSISRLPIDRAD